MSKSGMYGEMPIIEIGKFTIAEMSDKENEDSVWIQNTETDEAGQFHKIDLEPLINKFFNELF